VKKNAYFSMILAALFIFASMTAQAAVVLDIGSSGSNVVKVQKRLIQWDYLDGVADGRYGPKTQAAVKLFQRRNGIPVTGKVSTATATALGVTLTSSGGGSKTTSSTSATITSSDHRLLSKLVSAEARGEPYKGQVAVAAVVLNRVRSPKFPNTISGVIYQRGQFSVVSNGSINRTPTSSAIRAARDAMNGWDPTGGCLFFYNPSGTSDAWIRTRNIKTVIGRHYFGV